MDGYMHINNNKKKIKLFEDDNVYEKIKEHKVTKKTYFKQN